MSNAASKADLRAAALAKRDALSEAKRAAAAKALAKRGLPIVGDQTYGNFPRNREFAKAAGTKVRSTKRVAAPAVEEPEAEEAVARPARRRKSA